MSELETTLRGAVVLGEVQSIDDAGEAQTITVQTHAGVVRSGVEVASIHGLATNPGTGASCVLLAIGGDQGHLVALPLMGFGTRFGGVPAGGVALYDDAGNHLAFTADGNATLAAAGLLRLVVQTLSIEAQGGTTVHGPVTFTDPVTFAQGATFQADVTVQGTLRVSGAITGATVNGRA